MVPVTYDRAEKLNEELYSGYKSFFEKCLIKKISDNSLEKTETGKQIQTVNKVFNQRAMPSSLRLVLKIVRQFEGIYEKRQFCLVKNRQAGWISA